MFVETVGGGTPLGACAREQTSETRVSCALEQEGAWRGRRQCVVAPHLSTATSAAPRLPLLRTRPLFTCFTCQANRAASVRPSGRTKKLEGERRRRLKS